MSRPETIKDVKERTIEIGRLEIDKIMVNPPLMKAYVAFLEALEKQGGKVVPAYGATVNFNLPRTESQLYDQLRTDQYHWDDCQKLYNRALFRHNSNVEEPKEYQKDRIKEWAEAEGLPDPYGYLAVDDFSDEELDRIRQDLGIVE